MRRRALFVFILMILNNTALQAEVLYGFEQLGQLAGSRLVKFDVQNGQVTDTLSSPVLGYWFQSGTFDDRTGTLYTWEENTDSLFTLDLNTGLPTIIGGSGALPGDVYVSCLAINPITNDMFAMSYNGNLYQVDKTNGHRTFIGDVSSVNYSHGLAFSPDGVLYCSDTIGTNSSKLFTINTETAEASFVAAIPRDYVVSIDFDMNGILYGAENGTDQLGIIDITNGQWTSICTVEDGIFGMAFGAVPEPATLLLLGFGGLLIRKRRD